MCDTLTLNIFSYDNATTIIENLSRDFRRVFDVVQNGLTWYFRSSFSLSELACIQTLSVGTIINDAVIVYINGHELFRSNMPGGAVNGKTPVRYQLLRNTSYFIIFIFV